MVFSFFTAFFFFSERTTITMADIRSMFSAMRKRQGDPRSQSEGEPSEQFKRSRKGDGEEVDQPGTSIGIEDTSLPAADDSDSSNEEHDSVELQVQETEGISTQGGEY